MTGGTEAGGAALSRPATTPVPPATTRPRVLLLIKCLGHGGAERLLVDMGAHRDRDAFDYEVAYVLRHEDGLVPAMERTGVAVHALGAEGHWDLRWMAALRRLLVAGHYDVVHSHLPYAATLGRLVALSLPRNRRPRLVYTEHSMWDKMAVLVKVLNRATIGADQELVVVSESARQALPPALRPGARVVVHGVDLARSQEVRARRDALRRSVRGEFGVDDAECLAVVVANLRPEKGHDTLLEALALLKERAVPLRVVAAGRGPRRAALEDRARTLALGSRLVFAGDRDDALELVAGSDLFVLPSRQEGLPVALMEAASVGATVVATAVGEIPRLFASDVDAVLVPPEQPVALADAVEALVADPARRARLGAAALASSARFDLAGATVEIEDLYRRVLERR